MGPGLAGDAMSSPVSIDVSCSAGCPNRCGAVAFRLRGRLRVTVIAKATFSLVPGGVAALASPAPLVGDEERHDAGRAGGSVRAASDLAPHRPRVDVTFVGHAWSPGGAAPAAAVRLAIFRERALLDKTIHVYGDRGALATAGGATAGGATAGGSSPFEKMPLVYERAAVALDDASGVHNPVGTAQPNLVDVHDPRKPACFGPISRDWPGRARLLGATDRRALDAAVAEIPDPFEWSYFQAAPPDQQIEALRGGEWIVLDGLHPTLPRVQTRLPRLEATARVERRPPACEGAAERVTLVADTRAIDGDRQTCDVVWRGSFLVAEGEAALPLLRIVVALDLPEAARPEPAPRSSLAPRRGAPVRTQVDVSPPSPWRLRFRWPRLRGARSGPPRSPARPGRRRPPRACPGSPIRWRRPRCSSTCRPRGARVLDTRRIHASVARAAGDRGARPAAAPRRAWLRFRWRARRRRALPAPRSPARPGQRRRPRPCPR